MRNILMIAATFFVPGAALAHTGHDEVSGFASGILHPITGADHLLAMLAVGLIAALCGGRMLMAMPLAFVGAMLAGAGLGLGGMALPGVDFGSLPRACCLAAGRHTPATSPGGSFAWRHGAFLPVPRLCPWGRGTSGRIGCRLSDRLHPRDRGAARAWNCRRAAAARDCRALSGSGHRADGRRLRGIGVIRGGPGAKQFSSAGSARQGNCKTRQGIMPVSGLQVVSRRRLMNHNPAGPGPPPQSPGRLSHSGCSCHKCHSCRFCWPAACRAVWSPRFITPRSSP